MTPELLREDMRNEEREASQYCTFYISNLYFGVDVRCVQEVLRAQEVTRVPQSPAEIAGLINLRGQIVPAIHMGRRLGLESGSLSTSPMNMVIRTEDGAASLLVDEIGDVLDADPAAFEPVPDNLMAEYRELIRGVCKLGDRLLLVLDAERALDLSRTQQSHHVG